MAQFVDGMCQRYSCLPSALLKEPADLLLKMGQIIALVEKDKDGKS